MTEDLLIVGVYLTTLAPFLATAWVYAPLPWRSSPMGVAVMRLLLSLSAVLLLAVMVRLLHLPTPAVWVLRLLALGGVQVAGWLLFRQFRRYSRKPVERNLP